MYLLPDNTFVVNPKSLSVTLAVTSVTHHFFAPNLDSRPRDEVINPFHGNGQVQTRKLCFSCTYKITIKLIENFLHQSPIIGEKL